MDLEKKRQEYSSVYDEEPVFYCTRCHSLMVIHDGTGKHIHCGKCGAKADKIDVTSIERWTDMYIAKFGKHPLCDERSPYDDLAEAYNEDATEELTASEAIANNLIVRDCINLRINE